MCVLFVKLLYSVFFFELCDKSVPFGIQSVCGLSQSAQFVCFQFPRRFYLSLRWHLFVFPSYWWWLFQLEHILAINFERSLSRKNPNHGLQNQYFCLTLISLSLSVISFSQRFFILLVTLYSGIVFTFSRISGWKKFQTSAAWLVNIQSSFNYRNCQTAEAAGVESEGGKSMPTCKPRPLIQFLNLCVHVHNSNDPEAYFHSLTACKKKFFTFFLTKVGMEIAPTGNRPLAVLNNEKFTWQECCCWLTGRGRAKWSQVSAMETFVLKCLGELAPYHSQ